MSINSGFYNCPMEYGASAPVSPVPSPPETDPEQPERTPRRRGQGIAAFFIFLLLICGGTAAALALDWQEGAVWLVSMDGTTEVQTTAPPTQTAAPTTVERAPVGDGTTLEILPVPDGEPLSFQEIYRMNVDCIVGVRGTQEGGYSLGTGVILSECGYIITNAHVIEGCSRVDVVAGNEQTYPAKLVGFDRHNDLAVLKILPGQLPAAHFGDSDALQVGDVALAIGNPLGEHLKGTMTDGIISSISRNMLVDGERMVLLQTTAALNSGNSGGALINQYGQVVGITNMKMSSYYNTIEGLGFAIPSTTVKTIADELIAHGYISGRPALGITGVAVSAQAAAKYGFPADLPAGVWVSGVAESSDAWTQGLRPGDVIIAADGVPVVGLDDLLTAKAALRVGDAMALKIYRGGDSFTLHIQLMEEYLAHQ